MKLISLKCPQCGAALEVDSERPIMYCQFCGNKILVDDEVKRAEITHIIRDEARIREVEAGIHEIELEKEWQANRKRSIKKWVRICLAALIVGAVVLGLGVSTSDVNNNEFSGLYYLGMILFAIGSGGFFYGGIWFLITNYLHNAKRYK